MVTLEPHADTAAVIGDARVVRSIGRPLTMSEQIAESVTEAVLNGEYQPGDHVREHELASLFQVSRGPIREAFRILEKSGVVRIVPQRGAHITKLSGKEVNDLFEMRRVLVGLLVRKLCPPAPAFIGLLDREVSAMEALLANKDAWDEHFKISLRIGRLLFAACDNQRLVDTLEALVNQTARYTKLGMREFDRRMQSAAGWRSLVAALTAGNPDTAAAAVEGLIEASRLGALRELSGD